MYPDTARRMQPYLLGAEFDGQRAVLRRLDGESDLGDAGVPGSGWRVEGHRIDGLPPPWFTFWGPILASRLPARP
jgi:hypothetical protein